MLFIYLLTLPLPLSSEGGEKLQESLLQTSSAPIPIAPPTSRPSSNILPRSRSLPPRLPLKKQRPKPNTLPQTPPQHISIAQPLDIYKHLIRPMLLSPLRTSIEIIPRNASPRTCVAELRSAGRVRVQGDVERPITRARRNEGGVGVCEA